MPIEVKRPAEPRGPGAERTQADRAPGQDAELRSVKEAFGAQPADAEKVKAAFRGPDGFAREQVAQRAAKQLLGAAALHKEVTGTGQESRGKGDVRINERRAAVRALLAGNNAKALSQLGPEVQRDVDWLQQAEFRDYVAEAVPGQFKWAETDYIKSEALDQVYEKRLQKGQAQAAELADGTRAFLDVSDGSLIALHFMSDPALRSRSLADALLQFRGRVDPANIPTQESTRLDREGPLSIAEQRILLAEAKLNPKSAASLREYALLRLTLSSHPISSVNGIYEARNAVSKILAEPDGATAWIKADVPPGAVHSPYVAIHHNFSRDTPRDIAAFVQQWVFPLGPEAERAPLFLRLTDALRLARAGDEAQARALVTGVPQAKGRGVLAPLAKRLAGAPDAQVGDVLAGFLRETATKSFGANAEQNLLLAAQTYRAVCADEPTAGFLESNLFLAGAAQPKVADVIAEMRAGHALGALVQLGLTRQAMRDAIFAAKTGYQRHQLFSLDAQLERLTNQELGLAVDRLGTLETPAQQREALVALQTALRSALASGFQALKSDDDPAAKRGPTLEQVLADVDAMLAQPRHDLPAYRALMDRAFVAATRTDENSRALFDARALPLAQGGVELDGEFAEQLAKQSPLHYATALAQKGMAVGLEEEISPRRIANVTGMRVLNRIGPVFFPHVVVANDARELAQLQLPKDALVVLFQMDEKKLVMAGGLWVDAKDAPGGRSHLNVLAMNNGIPVLALPELRTRYLDFLKNAAREGGVYVDDSKGQVEMMTAGLAREKGLLTVENAKALLPGNNRRVTYLAAHPDSGDPSVLARHETFVNESRPTRDIELYVPQDEVRGVGKEPVSFAELAKLGIAGRHLAGEKGLVLALLRNHPVLGKYVPDGSVVTTGSVRQLLADAGLTELWERPWKNDPKVHEVTDDNFLQSAFYTDAKYRARTREALFQATHDRLTQLLVTTGPDGAERLTEAGERLYAQLARNPALAASASWIARSSFTGEDRPGKSGAGQYESYPNLTDPVSRVKGIIGVVESAWHVEPVENNVSEEINLRHIMPAVVVQDCLDPDISGVVISRDVDNGARGRMTYQFVRGFGGGVEGGKAEEGVVGVAGHTVNVRYPDAPDGLVSAQELQELRKLVLDTERYFDDVVEKGKGHAVDMEVARVGGQWKIVQARVVMTGAH